MPGRNARTFWLSWATKMGLLLHAELHRTMRKGVPGNIPSREIPGRFKRDGDCVNSLSRAAPVKSPDDTVISKLMTDKPFAAKSKILQ